MTIIQVAMIAAMQLPRQMASKECQSKWASHHPILEHKQPCNIPNILDTIQTSPNRLTQPVFFHHLAEASPE
jgi:hypothetical protein